MGLHKLLDNIQTKWHIGEMKCGLKDGMNMKDFQENDFHQGFILMKIQDIDGQGKTTPQVDNLNTGTSEMASEEKASTLLII
ncbi:periphilin-1 isoform B [Alligator mississippiensis]|uniref:Periphilin-1 isoform B n=1 Tax=Alligator mississippiensis TaxID=8496 RepID=A0A151PF80_ALLMI|nr:periphilin-1 isoform B [Alligator mississippiensis]